MARVVVVSGGGTGIGRAVARSFVADGEQVVLLGRRAEPLREAARELAAAAPAAPVALPLTVDLAEPTEVTRVRDELVDRFGAVDVLVNNAGGNALVGGGAPDDGLAGVRWHWESNFRTNVLTAVLLTEALRDVLTSPGGRVLFLSSIAAYRGSGSGSYGGAKAALHPYAFDLSAALGERGITVNVVAPGYVVDTEFFGGGLPAARHDVLVGQTHTGRASRPDDVAASVHWLAAPEAAQITAQIVQVNGGAERGR
ncbi:SDR family oxidoreductase [Polymorphospora rubra]|uniref:SDR family NAD(P)-dependent oxidoreductase n=1 Tax=Polymorphospora rubra TaxID=338584 RepID=UPI0033C00893